jgi:hypothetical protein
MLTKCVDPQPTQDRKDVDDVLAHQNISQHYTVGLLNPLHCRYDRDNDSQCTFQDHPKCHQICLRLLFRADMKLSMFLCIKTILSVSQLLSICLVRAMRKRKTGCSVQVLEFSGQIIKSGGSKEHFLYHRGNDRS